MIKLLASFLFLASAAAQSPCPEILTVTIGYEGQDRWSGDIHLKNYPAWTSLTISLDKKADLLGNSIGEVVTNNNIEYTVTNLNVLTTVDRMRFFVKYDPLQTPPKVESIRVDGNEICKDASNTYKIPENGGTIFTSKPTMFTPKDQEHHCGRVHLNAVGLVLGGSSTLEGQWPWQVALYRTEKVNHNFICGGTLVSHQHVITAAHCTTHRRRPVNKNSLTVYLGVHYLTTAAFGTQIRYVTSIINHPEYNNSNKRNDLSILILRDSVEFTDLVQPACLWPDSLTDLEHVVGKRGSVVGWGNDDSGELKMVEMPVVDQLTCIRSNANFYNKFTSDYTFCAGDRDGNSACNGDSGGGMVFQLKDSWYIRGIVSLSVAQGNNPICDPMQYIIFTDIAKYLPWIKANTQKLSEDLSATTTPTMIVNNQFMNYPYHPNLPYSNPNNPKPIPINPIPINQIPINYDI